MISRLAAKAALFTFATLSLSTDLSAQSTDEVKLDVLSALSTPLPITLVGPLLTRDVVITEEGDGFRATLQDSSLMGLFPFGDVSMKLVALDDDTYQVSDLQFPKNLDFPGLVSVSFSDMTLDGVWSATDRSYSTLKAELTEIQVLPEQDAQGMLAMGRLAFDVQKEPDEIDTESRFDITLGDIRATGIDDADVTIGEVQALLSANGEHPVDLYSLLREVMIVASLQDGNVGLQTLGESLLGNTYGTVAMDLKARDLNIIDTQDPEDTFFRATGLQARLGMQDVSPRDWGVIELSAHLDGVKQQNLIESGAFAVERAVVRLRGAELPVANIFSAIHTLNLSDHTQPIRVTKLLDGFLEFGALELTTEGEALTLEIRDSSYVDDEWVEDTAFTAGYDSWGMQIALEGLNNNQGVSTSIVDLKGGSFIPGPNFADEDLRHVEAWYPIALRYGGRVSNLNEAFLKQVFQDVLIQRLDEPLEIILPLVLYASASVFEILIEDNHYKTGLFSLEQSGTYRVFPGKFMSMAPIEGRLDMRMTGFDALVDYFEEIRLEEVGEDYGDEVELSLLKSVATVLRNLGSQDAGGTVTWRIEKKDVDRSEITINGTTLYYPEISQFIPLALFRMGL